MLAYVSVGDGILVLNVLFVFSPYKIFKEIESAKNFCDFNPI